MLAGVRRAMVSSALTGSTASSLCIRQEGLLDSPLTAASAAQARGPEGVLPCCALDAMWSNDSARLMSSESGASAAAASPVLISSCGGGVEADCEGRGMLLLLLLAVVVGLSMAA